MKSDRWQKKNVFDALFWALFAVMAVYYGYRLFALTPWYDELYTYYCFISKGPVYAAIHWPLPNNHVGYSVLSACLDCLGNSYIGLRGVSYLCALANMYLIYKIAARSLDGAARADIDISAASCTGWRHGGSHGKGFLPLMVVILYISVYQVNLLAVQGRGYTLGITCYLSAWMCLILICDEGGVPGKIYVVYALALILGLYTVSSNVYWVVPLCFSGGIYLLVKGMQEMKKEKLPFFGNKYGTKLVRLIAASFAAALGTVFLYAVIWVSIGSNLLVKDEAGIYYGMGHVKMILSSPFAALGRGMEYMLDTPYIQSEERAGFAGRLWEWLLTLSGYCYNSFAVLIMFIWAAGILFLAFKIVQGVRECLSADMAKGDLQLPKDRENGNLLLYLFLFIGIIFIPLCLLVQCKRPYYRVFAFTGVLLAFLIGVFLKSFLDKMSGKVQDGRGREVISSALFCLLAIFALSRFGFSGYNEQYGMREHEIADAFSKADIGRRENYCVTDCNQEYLLYFLYGIRCENREIEGADVVLLDKRMADPDFDEMVWEFYHYYDTIPWDYIEQNLSPVYENENYILYCCEKREREEKNEK